MLGIKKLKYNYIGILAFVLIFFNCSDTKSPVQPPSEPEVIVNPQAKVLKDGTMQYVKAMAENEIIFGKQAEGISDLQIGNLIVSGEGKGLLRKVMSIETTENEINVQTQPAKLTDIFEQASIHVIQQLNPNDFNKVSPLKRGLSFIGATDNLFHFEAQNLVLYDGDGKEETINDQVKLNGRLSLSNPTLKIEIGISSFKIKYLLFTGTMDETSDIKVISEIPLINIKKEIEIARLEGNPMVIMVGGIPVVLTPVLSVSVGIDLESRASVMTSVKQHADFTAGIEYKNGKLSQVSDFSNNFNYDPPTVTINCKLKGFTYPKFELLLYNFVSLYLKPVDYLEIAAEINRNPWWELFAGLDVFIGVAVDVFNLFDIKYEYLVIEYRYLIADAGNSFNFPAVGLIAYYPFNGNAYDESENKNHGTVHEAVLTADRFGNVNNAYSFDGINDYIEIPYTAANHPGGQITVQCWFKIYSYSGHKDIVSTNQYGGYALEFHGDNNLYWVLRIGSKYIDLPVASSEVTLNEWHFLAGTYDGTKMKIYLDGALKNEINKPGSIHYDHKNSVLIGADAYEGKGPDPGFGYFKGDIDEIRIYDRVLTAEEIVALYNKN